MLKNTEKICDFNILGQRFEITDDFIVYNSIRCEQERRVFEIEERYFSANNKMLDEFARLAQPEADKFIKSIRNNVKTFQQAENEGMNELTNYQAGILPEIGRHLIFKYTKNDDVTANDIARILFAEPTELYLEIYNGFFANIYNDLEQLESLQRSLEAKREFKNSTRNGQAFTGFGFGFRGTLTAAAGAAMTNTGMVLLRGFGDAIGYASDISRVEKETLKGLEKAKQDLLIMGEEQFKKLVDVCQDILYKDMEDELDALGRMPYKKLSDEQQRVISIKNENFDEAYAEGDIGIERYIGHIFSVISDEPYNINHYCNLYKIATEKGDNDAKTRILDFAGFLGLDKPLIRNLECESAEKLGIAMKLNESTLDEIEKKFFSITHLYGKEAVMEAERLNQKIKAESERLRRVAELKAEAAEKARVTRNNIAKYQGLISTGRYITTFITTDKTVGAVGGNKEESDINIKHLKKVNTISSRRYSTIALHTDGTASFGGVIYGSLFDRPDTKDWHDLIAVSAGDSHCVGLKKNGTLISKHFYYGGLGDGGQCHVTEWKNVIAISAGYKCTLGLISDGTVATAGVLFWYDSNKDTSITASVNENEVVSSWRDIVAISASSSHILGLREDGSVLAAMLGGGADKGQSKINDWYGIVAIATGWSHSVSLKWDGTVVAVGDNKYGQCNFSAWRNIVAISSTDNHTVGLRIDGTLVATGLNENGQCNVSAVRLRM